MNHLRSSSTPEICAQTYNFLPCTTTALGNLFLVLAYGFLNHKVRVSFLTAGSDLLLETIGPGYAGCGGHSHVVTLLLPMLGALPDALLVLASGLSGSREKAQNQVLVGMGLLAGSTIFLLTVVWGTCVVVGKCDIGTNSVDIDSTHTKGFSFTGCGISTDEKTSYTARFMAICVLPCAVALFPKMLRTPRGHRTAILLAAILSFLLALSYCMFQIFYPWIQGRRLAYAKHKHVISGILKHAQMQALGRLLKDDGTPNEQSIRKLFYKIDMDGSGDLSPSELHALVIGINFEEIDFDKKDAVDKIIDEFDTSRNDKVEEAEFVEGMKKWLNKAKGSAPALGAFSNKFVNDYHERTRADHDKLANKLDMTSDELVERVENPRTRIVKALVLMLVGTAIPAAFADPLVDAIYSLSKATRMPSFFVSFVALPLVNNSSEVVSAIRSMKKKKLREASLALSEVYGIVTVNNLMCLGTFLALIYARDITWDFSSELLIILLVCFVMGFFTSFRATFPLWTCLVAYSLYPLSLVTVHILDSVFHWS